MADAEVVPIGRQPDDAPADEPLLRDVLGDILRRERHAQDRTLSDVAEEARVSMAYLSEVERGRKEPSSEILSSICGALDIRLLDLVSEAHHELARAAHSTPSGGTGPVLALAA